MENKNIDNTDEYKNLGLNKFPPKPPYEKFDFTQFIKLFFFFLLIIALRYSCDYLHSMIFDLKYGMLETTKVTITKDYKKELSKNNNIIFIGNKKGLSKYYAKTIVKNSQEYNKLFKYIESNKTIKYKNEKYKAPVIIIIIKGKKTIITTKNKKELRKQVEATFDNTSKSACDKEIKC